MLPQNTQFDERKAHHLVIPTLKCILLLAKNKSKKAFLNKTNSHLPHSLHPADHTQPEVCLIVKDIDRKDRDYEKTVRKNQQLIEKCKLSSLIAQVNYTL